MELFDCAIIGAGSAGLSTGLVLGRARRKVAVFDNGTNRNRVTQKSHGFLTRDGIKPEEFRKLGLAELRSYPSVQYHEETVTKIVKQSNGRFIVETLHHKQYEAEKIVLATGIQEQFPPVPMIKQYYGKSLFNCPYCDGWELKEQPLIVIAENEEHALHMGKLIHNWSEDLVVATNGHEMSSATIDQFKRKKITVITEAITNLQGENGYLKKVVFDSGIEIERTGGFVVPSFTRPNQFAEQLGCEILESGAIKADEAGHTSQKNVYTAGEATQAGSSSLIVAAAEGNRVAASVNLDLTNERF
ncbi:NAD(P)/FAD-dependent oxidoreductase [Priestia megaterium]|nr:NAD(P)/FAD-dependent oxidoreductase [Priestia megaterium]